MFDRSRPYNDLPALPPAAEIETAAVLKKAIAASRALAELKGLAERMPNQAMLIDSLVGYALGHALQLSQRAAGCNGLLQDGGCLHLCGWRQWW